MFQFSYDGTNRKILWQEHWRHEFEEALRHDPVVIVPTGSVEQHGPHCPVDLDISISFYLAVHAAQAVTEFPVLVSPPLWFGLAHYNKGFPGTISLRPETYLHVLADVCRSIHENGFHRIVVVNGHGGNDAPNRVVRDTLSEEDIFLVAYSWWQSVEAEMAAWSEADAGSVGHGGEWETSVQLYLRRHLVDESRINADEFPNPFSPELRSFARFAERRRDTRDHTGTMGDATVASAEKGERIFRLAVERLAQVVREFHAQPVRHYREFGSHAP
ncbi:MAG: creatininase family protein [Anaerolineae bacterium]